MLERERDCGNMGRTLGHLIESGKCFTKVEVLVLFILKELVIYLYNKCLKCEIKIVVIILLQF